MTDLKTERDELRERLDKLTAFLTSQDARKLAITDLELLTKQQKAMCDYYDILNTRCERAGV